MAVPDSGIADSQAQALQELESLSSPQAISVVGHATSGTDLIVAVDLKTAAFAKVDGGLPVQPMERLYLVITTGYPWVPPRACVDHHRWDGYPHVLQGSRLCLYLDPDTEWSPLGGIRAYLERLWDWFADAIANRFDAATALYQPVGGVFHRTDGAPTVVVTEPLGDLGASFLVGDAILRPRSDDRLDLISWHRSGPIPEGSVAAVLVVLSGAMHQGGGTYLSDLAVTIRGQNSRNQRRQFLNAITKSARSLKREQHLHVLVAVPNEHLSGEARFHLIGWRLPQPDVAKAVEITGRRHKPDSPHPDDEPQVEWTFIDDARTGVTTRRDEERPVSWFAGKSVELWGCGALGSWAAEHLVRAGISEITLRDPGYVTAGLLVRQNYTELDVGGSKVDALADRLRAISHRVVVHPKRDLAQSALAEGCDADVIVDCTVNTGVAVALDQRQTAGELAVPVVQFATDNDTATLGILTVTSGEPGVTTDDLDKSLRRAAAADPRLAVYLSFWNPDNHPPLTPTLGCSVPTFHGSSADSSAIAAAAVTLAASALSRRMVTGYLFSSPFSGIGAPPLVAISPTDTVVDLRDNETSPRGSQVRHGGSGVVEGGDLGAAEVADGGADVGFEQVEDA
jgi:hypothetical protein